MVYLFIFFKLENQNKLEKYLFVMEYADCGSLRDYFKENYNNLTWENKFNLAYQLTCAVSCLHDEGIVHRDLVITVFGS
jgi:serine/threonine protein kinase